MFFKKSLISVTLITLFFLNFKSICAYEYKNPDNSDLVEGRISEIYMVKSQFEDFMRASSTEEPEIVSTNNDLYWWPIGSVETSEVGGKIFATGNPETVNMTSPYGYRSDPFGSGEQKFHSGQDIAGGRGLGLVNVIASKDGIVVYSGKDKPQCSSSSVCENCHGGYGNYVIIQHVDGNYTLYGHMHADSIIVNEGEAVSQGQVIGQVGSSGCSTGAHLHFEVRDGQNAYSAAVDPLNYIDPNNPRPMSSGDNLLNFISFLEGSTGESDGKYKVVDIGDGERTVGHGVTLDNNRERFSQYGVDVSKYPVGTYLDISLVDQIEKDILNYNKTYIEGVCANNSINLKDYQVDALITLMYQAGNINGFVDSYNKYRDTQDLFDNWWKYKGASTGFEAGVRNRRTYEWILFSTGVYSSG